MDFVKNIKDHTLEYLDDGHIYLVDGVIVPSITQMMKIRFGKKYENVNRNVLMKATNSGIAVHEAIEKYCRFGETSDIVELHNFQFLQKKFKFEVLDNECPVILFVNDEPMFAGRLDMVIKVDNQIGLADIKSTSQLDKEYLAYQLNLYRIAYRQSYGEEAEVLKGIHLKKDIRKFVDIPINENFTWEFIYDYIEHIGGKNE